MSEQQLTACKALGKLWNTLVLPNGGSMSQGFSRERTGKMAFSQSFPRMMLASGKSFRALQTLMPQ